MIGHVFATSGAVGLAFAPSRDSAVEHVVLAVLDGEYAVAYLPLEALPAPPHWPWATYFPSRTEAVASFQEKAGLETPLELVEQQVRLAEERFAALIRPVVPGPTRT